MQSFLFWLCLPFVLPQALYLRRTAPRFSAAQGPPEGEAGSGASRRLLAIGDSIIAGVGARTLQTALVGRLAVKLARELDCRISWQAIGSIGAGSRKVFERLLPRVPPQPVEFIVVSVGVNDTTGLSSLTAWRQNLTRLLEALHRHSPKSLIAVAGIPPLQGFPLLPQPLRALFGLRGRMLDRVAREVVEKFPTAVYVPLDFDPRPEMFSADGYHPSEKSYMVFGDAVAAQLLETPDLTGASQGGLIGEERAISRPAL